MRIVGLDIGSYSIKVAEIESNTGQLLRYFEHVLNPDPTKDRHLEIVDFLRNNLTGSMSQQGHIVVGLKQDEVTHRRVSFPFKERFKIEKSLSFELEDNMPFSSENAIFDFKIIGYDGKGSDLLALATPKTSVQRILQNCRDGGFDPHIVSMEAAALNNLIENWSELPPSRETNMDLPEEAGGHEAEAFLHMGHSHCVLILRSGNRLIDIKSFDGGGLDIAKSISTVYSMPLSEAIKQINTKAFVLINSQGVTKDQIAFSDVFKKSLAPLMQSIRLAFLDAESTQRLEIKSLKISGGLSGIRNIQPFLTQNLNVAVNVFTAAPQMVSIQNTPFDASRGLVALGLAIEGLRKARNPSISFLRGEFQRENKSLKIFLQNHGDKLRYAAVIYAMLFCYAFTKDFVSGYIASQADAALMEQGRAMKLKVSRLRSEAQKRINAFKESEKQKAFVDSLAKVVSALDILKEVSVKAPSRDAFLMEVVTLKISDEDVRIEGTLPGNGTVEKFKSNLSSIAKGPVEANTGTAAPPSTGGRRGFSVNFKTSRVKGRSQ